jgi:hypothetical protein
MKKLKFVGIIFLIGICFSFNDNDELTQEQQAQN